MLKATIGRIDRVLGNVALGSENNWIVESQAEHQEELEEALESLFTRWQRHHPDTTRRSFLLYAPTKSLDLGLWIRRVPPKLPPTVYSPSITQTIAAANAKIAEMLAAFDQRETAAKRRRA